MKHVEIYTDGSCLGNGNENAVGGWGAVLLYAGHERQLSGAIKDTTNNRAEMLAVINGLNALTEKCKVTLYSDSKYVINTMTQGWKRKKNTDLWPEMDMACANHEVTFVYVKGHTDSIKDVDNIEHNIKADELAQLAARKAQLGAK